MLSFPAPVLSFLFVSFRPTLLRSHSCSTGACLLLSAYPLLFRFLFDRFLSGSDYSASVSSFPFFPVSPLSGFPGARFRFRFHAFPFLSSLISRAFLPGSRTRRSVCFLSPFPDSLPQPFLRCLPCAFAFGLSAFLPLSFDRFRSASGYLAFCFFLSSFFLFPPHSGFLSAPLPLTLLRFSPFFPARFPVLSFPVLRTRLPVRFLSSFPVSLPQPFHRCFPSFPLPCVRI